MYIYIYIYIHIYIYIYTLCNAILRQQDRLWNFTKQHATTVQGTSSRKKVGEEGGRWASRVSPALFIDFCVSAMAAWPPARVII